MTTSSAPAALSTSAFASVREVEMPENPMRALVVERRSMSPLVRQFLDYASENVAQALGVLA